MVSAIRIGTASVNWGFDPFYTWAKTPPFERMLDEMARAGYAGTEISYNFPDDVAVLRSELESRNLQPAATFHAVDLRDSANHERAFESSDRVADRLEQLGSDVLILSDLPSPERLAVAGRVSGSDALDDAGWKAMSHGLNRIGERLLSRNMHAVFHPHVGTYVETRSEIDRLCAMTDPAFVGLCPDTGHLAYAGADPEAVFADYADRVGYVHLKDVDPDLLQMIRRDRIGFVRAVELGMFVELGTGMVSVERIVGDLLKADYSGWIVVEQDAPAEPLASATNNRRYLRDRFGL